MYHTANPAETPRLYHNRMTQVNSAWMLIADGGFDTIKAVL